ncbi:MAG: hypothetical protein RLZZ141_1901 [Pseudomonadota bacterium]|jgi:hypothetical protein
MPRDAFSVTYEVRSAGIDSPAYLFYDIASSVSLSGRRDADALIVGDPVSTEYCSQYAYCVTTRDYPYPLVITDGGEAQFSVDGLIYSRAKSDRGHDCETYDVGQQNERVMVYDHCYGLGIYRIEIYRAGQVIERIRLVSFRGLAGGLVRSR